MMLSIEQLLQLACAGQRFMEGQYQQVDLLADVLTPMRLETEDSAGLYPPQIRWQLPEQAVIKGDAGLLYLLLRNLLENAGCYAGEGLTQVRLEVEPDGRLLLEVSDEGPGVDEIELSRMTQPFQRLDGTRHGSGLGLNIVARIAYLHQAQLEVRNREDGAGLSVRVRVRFAGQGDELVGE